MLPRLPGARLEEIRKELPGDLQRLCREARDEGFRFLDRLQEEWTAGINRFDAPGEMLLALRVQGSLEGLGGLNRDSTSRRPDTGRLRRVYLMPPLRGQGLGRLLVEELLHRARPTFHRVQLYTDRPDAGAFYRACGFHPVEDVPGVSHCLEWPVATGA